MASSGLEQQFQRSGIQRLSVAGGVVIAVFIPMSWSMGMTANATVVAIASLLLFSVPLLLKVVSLTTATHYLCAVGALTFVSLASLGGGIRSPAISGFALIPMAVVFTLGRRSAIVWTLISTALIVGLYLGTDVFGWVPRFFEPAGYGRLIVGTHVAVIGLILWFALRFWRVNQRVVDRQETTIERTREMARHLEGATRELSDAAARFVRGGLLSQLADKASDGRDSITSARRGLSQMVDQYQNISRLVVTLYGQMERINELVVVIDRVSDRLDLMALNVGIEAARAGDIGKNFQILAQDMRRMSERVIEDTRQIKTLLGDIAEQAEHARESSERGIALTRDGNERIDAMAGSFDEVCALLEDTAGAADELTQATLSEIASIQGLVTATIEEAVSESASS